MDSSHWINIINANFTGRCTYCNVAAWSLASLMSKGIGQFFSLDRCARVCVNQLWFLNETSALDAIVIGTKCILPISSFQFGMEKT